MFRKFWSWFDSRQETTQFLICLLMNLWFVPIQYESTKFYGLAWLVLVVALATQRLISQRH